MTCEFIGRPQGRHSAGAPWRTGVWMAAGVLVALAGQAIAAEPDWSKIPSKEVTLFYPGQSTYQWLRSPEHKRAQREVMKGQSCVSCHEGEEADLGKKMVSGERLEPHPVPGKQATIALAVQVAHDAENLYMRAQWKTKQNYAGTAHPQVRFDGKEWKPYGWPQLDANVWEKKQPAIYEDRFSLMIDNGGVPGYENQGCWLTCHDGSRDTQKEAKADVVKAHPILGQALKKSDVRKYLPSTRTDEAATWDKMKSVEEIEKIKQAGGFLDLMQWRAHRSNPAGMADDGYVLEWRNSDAGKNMFASNVDAKHQPKYMFDEKKVGFKARTAQDLRDPAKPPALVVEENGVPFDPAAGWKEGDLLPEYYVSRKEAAGSAADNANVKGTWKDGTWTVVWTRKLNTGNPDDKVLKVGSKVTVGFAVHDDNITTRGHQVSFPMSIGIGADGDLKAVTLK
jgi:hypothetical protein